MGINQKVALNIFAVTSLLLSTSAMSLAEDKTVNGKSWDAKERFMIRGRILNVMPDERTYTSIGGKVTADNSFVPEVDFTYFFTDHFAAELIAAVSPHDMGAVNTGLGNLDLGSVWLLPPTLTAQYHINPHGAIRPYVGAGINYTHFFAVDDASFNSIEYKDNFGYAFQAGADIGIDDHWAFNLDVKKVYLTTKANINYGAVTAKAKLDPWIFGAGISYRF